MHAAVLRYVDQVARCGSIRQAAEILNVAPSAIARQIHNLEEELGCRLFERLPTGMRVLPAGQVFLRHTRKTLADWRNTQGEITSLAGEVAGDIRILATPPMIVSILLEAIAVLVKKHGRLQFDVSDANILDKAQQMQMGYPDIALLPFDRRFHQYELVDQLVMRVGVLVTPNHVLAGRESLTLTECAHHPVLIVRDNWIEGNSAMEFQETGASYEMRIISSSWPLVREAACRGLGVGFFTPVGVAKEIASGKLIFIALDVPGYETSQLSLYVQKDRRKSIEVSTTIEQLKVQFSTMRSLLPVELQQNRDDD